MESDKVVRHNVMAELEAVLDIGAAGIGVVVEDGIVTLSGHVPSHEDKSAAERIAGRIDGVRAVADEIEVRLPSELNYGDEEIARRAAHLLAGTNVPTRWCNIVVEDGWVTLAGRAPSMADKDAAERLVSALDGVRGVSTAITVREQV